ncbi:MAG TPA: YraN family protein [Candidatus Paceibacterota bacterium]|nr:YraN family protein [Candidatus Paceibacterota bacterium]
MSIDSPASATGSLAEDAASRYLTQNGYRVVARNWRKPWGELDIVAKKDGRHHFIEVKAQSREVAGFAAHIRAGRLKLAKVRRTARSWLASFGGGAEPEWQIDVIEVTIDRIGRQAHVTHFLNVETESSS